MKVTIKSWTAVAAWRWQIPRPDEQKCPICNNEYEATCGDDACRFPGDQCPITSGASCLHTFHSHCLNKWLNENNAMGKCPMCRQPFHAAPSSPSRSNARRSPAAASPIDPNAPEFTPAAMMGVVDLLPAETPPADPLDTFFHIANTVAPTVLPLDPDELEEWLANLSVADWL